MAKLIRLDKYISETAGLSRSQAKQYIKKGRVTVDGMTVKAPEQKLDPDSACVMADGKPCSYQKYIYLMLNKPAGVVSATRDPGEKTVIDCVDSADRQGHNIFPVGRLDKDTEGLVLLTDDGALAHRLLSPGKHVDKYYYAVIDKELGEAEALAVERGLDIGDDRRTLPAHLEMIGAADWTKNDYTGPVFAAGITIQEGRFHQVKRMMRALGARVLYLKRERMGSLKLDPGLKPGEYRPLTAGEVEMLRDDI